MWQTPQADIPLQTPPSSQPLPWTDTPGQTPHWADTPSLAATALDTPFQCACWDTHPPPPPPPPPPWQPLQLTVHILLECILVAKNFGCWQIFSSCYSCILKVLINGNIHGKFGLNILTICRTVQHFVIFAGL